MPLVTFCQLIPWPTFASWLFISLTPSPASWEVSLIPCSCISVSSISPFAVASVRIMSWNALLLLSTPRSVMSASAFSALAATVFCSSSFAFSCI